MDHDAIRQLRDRAIDAIARSDLDAILEVVHDDVVFTGMNGEVARGKDGVRTFFAKMMTGPDRIVKSISMKLEADDLTIDHGADTGIASGSSRDTYELAGGLSFETDARWTATLVLRDGHWLIASLHSSVNIFDNPVLAKAKRLAFVVGAVALPIGFVAGYLLGS